MAGFSAEWLALREPADRAARSVRLTRALADALPREKAPRILDLAAGTGSNLRYLAGQFLEAGADPRVRPDWLLVDHDPALLAQVPKTPGVDTHCMDLASLDDREIFDGRTLVTASALLDLVSEAWVRTLAARCAESGAAVLFALSYDGRIECSPEDPDEGPIVALVNEHQRTDKGFGPALGPDATNCAERCFASLGYHVQRDRSDWVLPPAAQELQRQLIDGWAQAVAEIAPAQAAMIDGWRSRRLAHVAAHRSQLIVGHQDLAGILGTKDLRIKLRV
jgi:hypothetical protein